ncbi:MAG: carboxylate--amine ligase, partial [Acidobacteria bacterium]
MLATTTGYQTRSFGEAAARLGVELVFATDRCHMLEDPWQDHAIPIRFYDEPRTVDAIVDAARLRPIDGILVVGDRPTVIAARVAQALGLPGNPPEA